MKNLNTKPILTPQDIAERWQAALYFVQELIDNGELPSFKVTDATEEEFVSRVLIESVEEWEKKQIANRNIEDESLEQSNIIKWLSQSGIKNEGSTLGQQLYNRYEAWCACSEREAVSNTRFGTDLIKCAHKVFLAPVVKSRNSFGIVYHGLSF